MRYATVRLFAQGRVAKHVAACVPNYFTRDGCPNFPCEPTEEDEQAFRDFADKLGGASEQDLYCFEVLFNEAACTFAVELQPEEDEPLLVDVPFTLPSEAEVQAAGDRELDAFPEIVLTEEDIDHGERCGLR